MHVIDAQSPARIEPMIVQDHARLLQEEMEELNSLVNPVLSSFVGSGGARNDLNPMSEQIPSPGAESAWQGQVALLFQEVNDINARALGVFGNVALLQGSAVDAVNALLRQLLQFKGDSQDFEQQVSSEFTGVGESPTLHSSLEASPK